MIDGQAVSLLMSSRNRPQFLRDAVRSALDGSTPPDEIVVVDQSDEPNEALAALKTPPDVLFQYFHSSTTGLSRSRNIAFDHASHPIVVVIDDDCIVAKDWLKVIVRALVAAGPRAVVTGRVLAGEPENGGGFAPSLHPDAETRAYRGRIPTDPLATFNFALRYAAYAEVGPFDTRIGPGTRFPAAEDNDYGHRLLQAGYTVVFEPAALVYHRTWRTASSYLATRYAYGRGQGAYYGKHLAAHDWYMLWKFAHALKRRGKRMLEGGKHSVAGEVAWIAGWAVGISDWLTGWSRSDGRFSQSPDGSQGCK